jgi:pimeloyl-ACP methyl ester carboxylesterase
MPRQPFDVTTADGAALAADEWAGPAPTVALLHAGVTDRRSWYAVADPLDGERRLVAYDRRGSGGSSAPLGDGTHLDDLLTVLDAVADEPVVLVGNSMGGGLALDAALLHPDRVAGLVLLAPSVGGAPEPTPEQIDPASMVLIERIDRALTDRDFDEVTRLEAWLWLDGPTMPEGRVGGLSRALTRDMGRRILALGADETAGRTGADVWSRLTEISVPTVVGCGEYDVPVLLEQSRRLAEALPSGEFRLLPQTAHLPGMDSPDAVGDLVRGMVDRLAEPSAPRRD